MRVILSPLRGFDSPLGVRLHQNLLRWILSNGFWRDENIWVDTEVWNDGA